MRTARSCAFKCSFCNYPTRAGALTLASLDVIEKELDSMRALGYVENVVIIEVGEADNIVVAATIEIGLEALRQRDSLVRRVVVAFLVGVVEQVDLRVLLGLRVQALAADIAANPINRTMLPRVISGSFSGGPFIGCDGVRHTTLKQRFHSMLHRLGLSTRRRIASPRAADAPARRALPRRSPRT